MRKLHSRMKFREVYRRFYWLEFENESILKFLAKYNIVMDRQRITSDIPQDSKIRDYADIDSQLGIEIDVIEV